MSDVIRLGAADPVVDLPTLRAHCRVDGADSDGVLALYLAAATNHVELWTGRALRPTTWQVILDGFPAAHILLPIGPLVSVDGVTYRDPDGATATMDPAGWVSGIGMMDALITPVEAWPLTDDGPGSVRVEWTAGATCPDDLRVAVLMIAGHLYENRETVVTGAIATELPLGAIDLMRRYRRFRV